MSAIATIATLATLTLSGTAEAAAGFYVDGIIVRGDDVSLYYANKTRSCIFMVGHDKSIRQAKKELFCDQGEDLETTWGSEYFHIAPGESIALCSLRDWGNCDMKTEVREAGDLNGDLQLNVIDIMLMYNWIMGTDTGAWPTNSTDELAADYNGDGDVNVLDFIALGQTVMGD